MWRWAEIGEAVVNTIIAKIKSKLKEERLPIIDRIRFQECKRNVDENEYCNYGEKRYELLLQQVLFGFASHQETGLELCKAIQKFSQSEKTPARLEKWRHWFTDNGYKPDKCHLDTGSSCNLICIQELVKNSCITKAPPELETSRISLSKQLASVRSMELDMARNLVIEQPKFVHQNSPKLVVWLIKRGCCKYV